MYVRLSRRVSILSSLIWIMLFRQVSDDVYDDDGCGDDCGDVYDMMMVFMMFKYAIYYIYLPQFMDSTIRCSSNHGSWTCYSW